MVKIDVPYIDRSVKFPTCCESVSAVMLLRYLGLSVSAEEYIDRGMPVIFWVCINMRESVTGSRQKLY